MGAGQAVGVPVVCGPYSVEHRPGSSPELGSGKLPGTNSVVWIYATASPCVWRAGSYEVTIEIGIEVEIDSETEYCTYTGLSRYGTDYPSKPRQGVRNLFCFYPATCGPKGHASSGITFCTPSELAISDDQNLAIFRPLYILYST